MQVTTGIDIIEVERIKEAIENLDSRFLNQIYTESEIIYCNKSNKMKYQHFAARFAVKEAVYKSISNYTNEPVSCFWKYIEVQNNENGRPKININLLKEKNINGLIDIDISISHIKDYAVANAVATFEKGII